MGDVATEAAARIAADAVIQADVDRTLPTALHDATLESLRLDAWN